MKQWKMEMLTAIGGFLVMGLIWLGGVSLVVFVIVKLLQAMGVL